MATEKQVKCIYALSKEMNKKVDWKELKDLPESVASEMIDMLREKQEASDPQEDAKLQAKEIIAKLDKQVKPSLPKELKQEKFDHASYGMAYKKITEYFISLNQMDSGKRWEMIENEYNSIIKHKRAVQSALLGVM